MRLICKINLINPTRYTNYRNFMIDAYRLNPSTYLTFTACRRNLSGDANTLLRIHSFLEYWGLINYKLTPQILPSQMAPATTGNFSVLYDNPCGVYPQFSHVKSVLEATTQSPLSKQSKSETNIVDKSSVVSNFEPVSVMAPSENTDPADAEEKTENQENKPQWTEQETLLLLEALEMHNENWDKVAEHVKSHNAHECIMHFLQLPIQDPHLRLKQGDVDVILLQ